MKTIHVSIRDQQLTVRDNGQPIRTYPVSTSRFGIGMDEGSLKTPTGRFRVAERIGSEMRSGSVFVGRVALEPGDAHPPTGELVMWCLLWLVGVDVHYANTVERF